MTLSIQEEWHSLHICNAILQILAIVALMSITIYKAPQKRDVHPAAQMYPETAERDDPIIAHLKGELAEPCSHFLFKWLLFQGQQTNKISYISYTEAAFYKESTLRPN
jgi:hypothetical protein